MPCGKISIPAPKLAVSVPFESNSRIVGRLETSPVARFRHVFAPQRSATQIDRPSRSMSTALVDPQVRPSGIFAHPSIVRYGLPCAARNAAVDTAAMAEAKARVDVAIARAIYHGTIAMNR